MPDNVILKFYLRYIHVSNSALYLHNTPVLSFRKDLV